MKIILLIAEHGYSFITQTRALEKGLVKKNINCRSLRVINNQINKDVIYDFAPDLVFSIGSWHSYHQLIQTPQQMGYKVVPWLVSDDKIDNYIKEYNKLELILTTSSHCKNIFIQGGIKENILKILPEAVDEEFWHPLPPSELKPFLKDLSLTDPEEENLALPIKYNLMKAHQQKIPIIFTTGGNATQKGAQEVISALAKISHQTHNTRWIYLVKTWSSSTNLTQTAKEWALIEKFGLHANIRYLIGEFSREFMRALVNLCDIYAAPSRSEGFGLPLVEAQMCGKPVITAATTSTQELVVNGQTGFVVKTVVAEKQKRADLNDLTDKLETLLTDDNLRDRLGKNAREFATSNFSPEVIATKLLEIISS